LGIGQQAHLCVPHVAGWQAVGPPLLDAPALLELEEEVLAPLEEPELPEELAPPDELAWPDEPVLPDEALVWPDEAPPAPPMPDELTALEEPAVLVVPPEPVAAEGP
jgi:hypothetical protein